MGPHMTQQTNESSTPFLDTTHDFRLKRARCPAKPADCRSFLADYHIEARRGALVLDIHDLPAVIASAYEPITQPTSEKNLPPLPTTASRQLAVKICPYHGRDPGRYRGHGGTGAWDFSPKLGRVLVIPCASQFVEPFWHLVFDLEVEAKMYETRLVVKFVDGNTHGLVETASIQIS